MNYPQSLINVIEQFKTLPGIGPKSAERIALHLLKADSESVTKLANSLIDLKNKIKYCKECSNLSENDLCDICNSLKRERNVVCIVETPRDLQAI